MPKKTLLLTALVAVAAPVQAQTFNFAGSSQFGFAEVFQEGLELDRRYRAVVRFEGADIGRIDLAVMATQGLAYCVPGDCDIIREMGDYYAPIANPGVSGGELRFTFATPEECIGGDCAMFYSAPRPLTDPGFEWNATFVYEPLFFAQFFSTDDSEFSFVGRIEAVPEPAAWAMMIGGFALAGAGLRIRRSAAAAFPCPA